jgi:hypothetical protein
VDSTAGDEATARDSPLRARTEHPRHRRQHLLGNSHLRRINTQAANPEPAKSQTSILFLGRPGSQSLRRTLPAPVTTRSFACSGAEDRAEALIERVTVFDGYGLGKATGGDRELIEEANIAEEDKTIAMPVRNEPDR